MSTGQGNQVPYILFFWNYMFQEKDMRDKSLEQFWLVLVVINIF